MALTNLSYKARPQSNAFTNKRPKSHAGVTARNRRPLPKFALNGLMPNSHGSTTYARADPPGTAGLPGHFVEMKT